MPDMPTITEERVDWEQYGTINAGTRVRVIVGAQTIFDGDVPAGKKLKGYIAVKGDLEDS